jgi:hypothetical protein
MERCSDNTTRPGSAQSGAGSCRKETIREFNLTVTQKTTLSTKKGSVHYHLKSGVLPGLLEATYWPQKRKLWVEIHRNRSAEWNRRAIASFAGRLADRLFSEAINRSGGLP